MERLRLGTRAWQWVLWQLMRSGYRPMRALLWLVIWWLVGFVAFGAGYQAGVLVPNDKEAAAYLVKNGDVPASYEPFCALSYAVDSALPIASLGQREKWHVTLPENLPVGRPVPRDYIYNFACRTQFLQGWIAPSQAVEWVATTLLVFRWLFVPIAWFLTTMLVAGVAGLVARE
jgi:hypothetical protein